MESNESLELIKVPSSEYEYAADGSPILKKELTEDGEAVKVFSKLRTFDKDEDVSTKEGIEKLKDHNWYESSYDGSYIGREDEYNFFIKEKGLILLQKVEPSYRTASIGYSPKEHKWYGWSHRAFHGFTIGDEVHEGDLTNTSGLIKEYEIQHPEESRSLPVGFKAENLYDAKRMAIAFACAVG